LNFKKNLRCRRNIGGVGRKPLKFLYTYR